MDPEQNGLLSISLLLSPVHPIDLCQAGRVYLPLDSSYGAKRRRRRSSQGRGRLLETAEAGCRAGGHYRAAVDVRRVAGDVYR